MNTGPDLFESPDEPQIVEDDSLSLTLWRNFVPHSERADMLRTLLRETPWRETELRMFGDRVKTPRLTCWYGDPGAVYTYSGVRNEPLPWTSTLERLRRRVEQVTRARFNSALLNLYRDGNDHVSWHSDDEKELGGNPIIASVSVGANRRFDFRRADPDERAAYATRSIELTDGSLLLMTGRTQHQWQHRLAKAARIGEPRINLTFRWVHARRERKR